MNTNGASASAVINKYFQEHFPTAISTANEARKHGKRYIWMTQSWLVAAYRNCNETVVNIQGPGAPSALHCPSKSELAEFEAAVARGDISWHAFPFNGEPELFSPALFVSTQRLEPGTAGAMLISACDRALTWTGRRSQLDLARGQRGRPRSAAHAVAARRAVDDARRVRHRLSTHCPCWLLPSGVVRFPSWQSAVAQSARRRRRLSGRELASRADRRAAPLPVGGQRHWQRGTRALPCPRLCVAAGLISVCSSPLLTSVAHLRCASQRRRAHARLRAHAVMRSLCSPRAVLRVCSLCRRWRLPVPPEAGGCGCGWQRR
jgi:hypothetical protein